MYRNPETGCHEWVLVPTCKFKFADEDWMRIVSEYLQDYVPA